MVARKHHNFELRPYTRRREREEEGGGGGEGGYLLLKIRRIKSLSSIRKTETGPDNRFGSCTNTSIGFVWDLSRDLFIGRVAPNVESILDFGKNRKKNRKTA